MNPQISHEAAANSGMLFSQQSRDTSHPVMLIGFQEQTNLGLGYLASTLRSHGYRAEILDFEQPREEILRAAQ